MRCESSRMWRQVSEWEQSRCKKEVTAKQHQRCTAKHDGKEQMTDTNIRESGTFVEKMYVRKELGWRELGR